MNCLGISTDYGMCMRRRDTEQTPLSIWPGNQTKTETIFLLVIIKCLSIRPTLVAKYAQLDFTLSDSERSERSKTDIYTRNGEETTRKKLYLQRKESLTFLCAYTHSMWNHFKGPCTMRHDHLITVSGGGEAYKEGAELASKEMRRLKNGLICAKICFLSHFCELH